MGYIVKVSLIREFYRQFLLNDLMKFARTRF